MYKKASKLKLRFETRYGSLSMEQLWDLSQIELAEIIKSLKSEIKKDSDDELSFLDENANQVNEIDQLRFDLVKDVYLENKAEIEAQQNEAERKVNNEKILEIIKKKQDSDLEGKTIEELEEMLK
jgi:hypothetical protein